MGTRYLQFLVNNVYYDNIFLYTMKPDWVHTVTCSVGAKVLCALAQRCQM